MFTTPILFLIYNRPDITEVVFNSIRQIKPTRLFIAADGPRCNKEGEHQKCELTKKIVLSGITWECEVNTLFRETNLGCKIAVSSAITWFFDNVEEGIILEDDCLPDSTFFTFCAALLEKYRDNTSVMHISGNNFNSLNAKPRYSYYFSNHVEIWGWATWRRAWKLYDINMDKFPVMKEGDFLQNKFYSHQQKEFWIASLAAGFENKVDTWDYQWVFSIYANDGVSITPYKNLVSNLGFRDDATHTTKFNSNLSNIPRQRLKKIVHPSKVMINKRLDNITFETLSTGKRSFFQKVRHKSIFRLQSAFKRLNRYF